MALALPCGPAAADGALPRSSFSALEHQWLRAMRGFGHGGSDEQIVDASRQCLKRALRPSCAGGRDDARLCGYSLVSISELQSQQRLLCCSHLTWSSKEFREWVLQYEALLPNQKILQRIHLVLIGYLTDEGLGKKDQPMDGSLYVQDNTGVLPCVLLHFKLEWLGCLMLFPAWIYIPQTDQITAGYVEILEDPVHVIPRPEKAIGYDIIPVFYPGPIAQLLKSRPQCKKMAKMNVAGELFRLSTMLYIHHKTFFFFFLKCFSSAAYVPVLVQKTSQLVWHHALQLGHKYVLTALKMSCLRASGLSVLITSSSSHLLPYCKEKVKEQFLDNASERNSAISTVACTQLKNLLEQDEEEMETVPVQRSKLISYIGTITQVLNAQAGLYELDNKFTLCLAYQQLLNSGYGLRPGARIELRDVHLVPKSLNTSCSILGTCLRSTVVLKSFSSCGTFHQPVVSFGNLYTQLLLRYNLHLSLYLWVVNMLETFEQRFCNFIQCEQLLLCHSHQARGAAEKFIVPILNSLVLSTKPERNIHQEILAGNHNCPLEEDCNLEPPCQIPNFSMLYVMVEKRCWESFSQLQQLSSASEIHNLDKQELNRRLAWSYYRFSAENFQPQMVLLGMLKCSQSGFLKLQDKSKALPCVIFRRDGRPFTDTSLIGCLLQIEAFQLTVEQFLQSDFPSWQQLMTHKYIKEKKRRVYVQFSFEDVKILQAPEKRALVKERTSSGVNGSETFVAEPRVPKRKASSLERAKPDSSTPETSKSSTAGTGYVAHLFLVTQKEGLRQRNYLQNSERNTEDGQAVQLSFQATALWMGKSELCSGSGGPEEHKISARQKTNEAQQKVMLLFVRKSLRWFPFLHPDHVYQLILPQCLDLAVFDKLCSKEPASLLKFSNCSLFLHVPDTAHLLHVSQSFQLAPAMSKVEQIQSSIAEILSPSFTGSLVSFSGVVVERCLCESLPVNKSAVDLRTQRKGNLLPWDYTVKLSISPAAGSSVLLDIYVEAPYLPYLWGMLPGARLLFQNLQRKVSKFGNVYCTYIASSCMQVMAPPPHDSPYHPLGSVSAPSEVYLFNVLLQPPTLHPARAICHLTCILSLSLKWVCSLCNSTFAEGRGSQCNLSCLSHVGMNKASARILVEDGTSEFVVLCKNQQVQDVLGLSPKEWDVVQQHVQSKGSIHIQHNDVSPGSGKMEEPEDLVTWYLRNLCRSLVVCRPILLTFRLDRMPVEVHEAGAIQLRRFLSNELEFLTQMMNRRNLLCLNIQDVT
ncbi:CST complex subunit CTC1 isoform X1 [Varanus komodoensis]|uniref:CST complex subunit CTC1 isoform X1 n=1 Tax=Varanus komodoensis TaxID=61221 RepID=UPI001CF7D401|nr:CST complex subunit CTC1 isoform X1 [Varanus komodoensis]